MELNDFKDWLLVILGWLFGILSPSIVSEIKDRREVKPVKQLNRPSLGNFKSFSTNSY
jgi:hypothetical protein